MAVSVFFYENESKTSESRYVKGVPFSIKRYTEGVPFLPKCILG